MVGGVAVESLTIGVRMGGHGGLLGLTVCDREDTAVVAPVCGKMRG
jgi:hypothetical protein